MMKLLAAVSLLCKSVADPSVLMVKEIVDFFNDDNISTAWKNSKVLVEMDAKDFDAAQNPMSPAASAWAVVKALNGDGNDKDHDDKDNDGKAPTIKEPAAKAGKTAVLRRIQAPHSGQNTTATPTPAPTRAQAQAERAEMTQAAYNALPWCLPKDKQKKSETEWGLKRDQCKWRESGIVTGLASTKSLGRDVLVLIVLTFGV